MSLKAIDEIKSRLSHSDPIIGKYHQYNNAAVLLPLVSVAQELYLLYQVRSHHIRQGGEISFPGGMREAQDGDDLANTALRETCEELGLCQEAVTLLGFFGTLVHASGMTIDAYVGFIDDQAYQTMTLSEEVSEVFLVPLAYFKKNNPKVVSASFEVKPTFYNKEGKIMTAKDLGLPQRYQGGWAERKRDIYFYQYEDHMIWGMTGEITYAFINHIEGFDARKS